MSSLMGYLLDEDQAQKYQPRPEPGGAILAVDIGNIHTRAVLLDIVDGMYHFVARGEAPSTASPPWNNVLEGLRLAIEQISAATGRQIMDSEGALISPEQDAFYGVNTFVATASAGRPVRAVLVGLMPDVSMTSGRRAAESTYMLLVDTFSLADRRTQEQQVDALLQSRAELVLIVGGTDGGAVRSMLKQIDTVAMACSLMEKDHRPAIFYAGNKDIRQKVEDRFADIAVRMVMADNVRPALESERLDGAQGQLAELYHMQRAQNTGGYVDIGNWTEKGVSPTAYGFRRGIHVLGTLESNNVLGIDLGSSDTTVATSIRGTHYLNVLDGLGMGHTATGILEQVKSENLLRWLTYEPASPDDVVDYVWNKWLFPQTVPASYEELEIEYGMAREIMRTAVLSARTGWRGARQRGPLPLFDTLVLSGSTLTRTPNYGWSALIALDALLPMGMTRLLLDPYGLTSALGAIAPFSRQAAVQVLETGAYIDAGLLITVSGRARRGEIVLRGSLKTEDSASAETFEVTYGSIAVIPISPGVEAELTLQPRNTEVEGLGQRVRRLKVKGGELGLVVDARGRPWRLPREAEERRTIMRQWQESLAGERIA